MAHAQDQDHGLLEDGHSSASALQGAHPTKILATPCQDHIAYGFVTDQLLQFDLMKDDATILAIVPNQNAKWSLHRSLGKKDPAGLLESEGHDDPLLLSMDRDESPAIHILTLHELCLSIIRTCDHQDAPIILDPIQEKMLLEDMKVLGGKTKRIEEMLKFLCRSISELAFVNDGWLISDEERTVVSYLSRLLKAQGALLPSLVSACAWQRMRESQSAQSLSAKYLFALGFSSYDKAGQEIVKALATDILFVSGDVDDPGVRSIPYGFPQGFKELIENPTCELLKSGASDPCNHMTVECADRAQETAFAYNLINERTGDGESTIVISPNMRWIEELKGMLEQEGLSFQLLAPTPFAKLDPRKSSDLLTFYAALGILASPSSVAMLRIWLGVGDWLCMSNLWKLILDQSEQDSSDVLDTIISIAQGNFDETDAYGHDLIKKGQARFEEAQRLITKCSKLTGKSLIAKINELLSIDPDLMFMQESHDIESYSAEQLFDCIHTNMLDIRPYDDSDLILALHDRAFGLFADHVLILACVDGNYPSTKACDETLPIDIRSRLIEADKSIFLRFFKQASKNVVCTFFETMDLTSALDMSFDVKRIYVRKGRSLAKLSRSRFIEHAAPISASAPLIDS